MHLPIATLVRQAEGFTRGGVAGVRRLWVIDMAAPLLVK